MPKCKKYEYKWVTERVYDENGKWTGRVRSVYKLVCVELEDGTGGGFQ